ncbi:MAG: apolipoprotein N-acyltransferase [Thermoanaerobaculum sp.]|nr:apolipoprotein N-acyltransferase [Thermoanaerobaculum sp.]MDW7966633.1 apolipoprotein N-acyltransferase [Thermoanaerobaculum sp.]
MTGTIIWRGILAGAAGLLWALALPRWHWVGTLPLAAVALLSACRGLSPRSALFLGFLAGFCHWVFSVFWVVEVMTRYGHLAGALAFLALGVMSAVLASFWGLAAWLSRKVRHPWRGVALALGLTVGEVVQGLPPWNFPWNPLVTALVPWPFLLAPLPVLGATTYGLALRVVLFGAAEAVVEPSWKPIRAVGAALGVVFLAGLASPVFRPAGGPLWVAAIQPNVPLEVRWDAQNLGDIEGRVWRLSEQAVQRGAQWVVWPESAVPRWLERDALYREALRRFSASQGVWLTLNSIGFGEEGEYFNSMYMVSPQGLVERYDKVHLVPFGEYVPDFGRLAFLRPLVREVGGFTPGREAKPLPGPAGPVGGAVCYEVAFPLHAAEQVRRGAKLLVTVTNDGWYGDSAAPYQHLALAILRAVEQRRYLVRAANTGISAIVDPYGVVQQQLPLDRQGLLVGQVQGSAQLTPAARLAPLLHLWPLMACAVVILAALGRRWTTNHLS